MWVYNVQCLLRLSESWGFTSTDFFEVAIILYGFTCMVILLLCLSPLYCISMQSAEIKEVQAWIGVVSVAYIYRRVCTILKTTFITFKSPLWIDHLLSYVIQVIPREKIEANSLILELWGEKEMYIYYKINVKFMKYVTNSSPASKSKESTVQSQDNVANSKFAAFKSFVWGQVGHITCTHRGKKSSCTLYISFHTCP